MRKTRFGPVYYLWSVQTYCIQQYDGFGLDTLSMDQIGCYLYIKQQTMVYSSILMVDTIP